MSKLLRLVAMAALVLCVLTGCGRSRVPRESVDEKPIKVQTAALQSQRFPETYEVVGTVRPKVSATISAKVMALIEQVPVKPGDTVKAGDVLAQLDDRELRAAFQKAEADYKRLETLLKEGAASRAEFDTAEARFSETKAALSYASVLAPFDGIVADKFCDAGNLATPGKPLFVMEQPTDFRLEAYVPERFGGSVPIGTTVHIVVEAVGGECDGVVGEVVPASDPTSRSFLVKVDLHRRKPLKSGMFGRAQFPVGERSGLFVPKSLVRERGQLTFVFVADGDRARMRLVKTGKSHGDLVELLSGMEDGEKLIVNADRELMDGQRIEPQPR